MTERNKHIEALMAQWADLEITDADLLELLTGALAELAKRLRELEED